MTRNCTWYILHNHLITNIPRCPALLPVYLPAVYRAQYKNANKIVSLLNSSPPHLPAFPYGSNS